MDNKLMNFILGAMAITIIVLALRPTKVVVLGNDNENVHVA